MRDTSKASMLLSLLFVCSVRVPQRPGLAAAGGAVGLQRVQHVVVCEEVHRRRHHVHAGPLWRLLLHQRRRGQLPRQREAHRHGARRGPQRHRRCAGAVHHPTSLLPATGADHRTPTFVAPSCKSQRAAAVVARSHASDNPRVTAACRSCSHDAFCFVVIAPCCYSTVDPAICAGRCLAGRPLLAHPVRERDDDGHKAACR
jgi:hypothetical protein